MKNQLLNIKNTLRCYRSFIFFSKSHLLALNAQLSRITPAPLVLPRLLARMLVRTFILLGNLIIVPNRRGLQLTPSLKINKLLKSLYSMAGSSFRSLSNIPYCCLKNKLGPFFSPTVANHSLKSAKYLQLGKPLPYQLPNPKLAY